MKKTKRGRAKVLGGALIGVALGVASGMLLAPKSGKKLRKDVALVAADFYQSIAPKIKKASKMGEKEFKAYAGKAAALYAKAKKLTAAEAAELGRNVQMFWKHLGKATSDK